MKKKELALHRIRYSMKYPRPTLTHTLIIALLTVVLTIFSAIPAGFAEQGSNGSDRSWADQNLTEEEKSFLSKYPVMRLGIGVSFPPFQYVQNDRANPEFRGMVSSYLKLLENRLGIKLEPVYGISFKEALELGQSKQIDIFPCVARTPERETFLIYTKPYLSYPLVIISREGTPLVGGITDLEGMSFAVAKSLATYSKLRNEYPDLKLKYVFRKTLTEVLEAVSLGEAEACIANLAVASYEINKRGLRNLQVASPTPWGNNKLAMAVRDDWPQMQTILQKALDSISSHEKNLISEEWIRLKVESVIESSKVWMAAFQIAGVVIIIFAAILYWNSRLHREILERQKTEALLAESEERYKMLSAASFEAIFLSEDGILISMNRTAKKMFGYSGTEFVDFHLLQFFHPDSHRTVSRKLENGVDTMPYEAIALRKGEKSFPCEVQAKMIEKQGRRIRITALRDITLRKKAEEERAQSERIFHRIFESSPLPMQEVDMSPLLPIFERWNREGIKDVRKHLIQNPGEQLQCLSVINPVNLNMASVKLYGAENKEQLIGKRQKNISPKSLPVFREAIAALASGLTYFHNEIHWENLQGEGLDTLVYVDVVDGYEKTLERVLITFVDITENKKLIETIQQAEKMISIGGLAAGMAHEINNPLAGILQGIQNIKRRFSEDLPANIMAAEELGIPFHALQDYMKERKVISTLDGIHKSGERAARVVLNMLNFSRGSSALPVKCDINRLLEETLEVASNDFDLNKQYDFKKISIIRDYDTRDSEIKVVPSELEQVFLNLFKNSAQAMTDKEYSSSGPEIRITTRTYRKNIIIRIRDNGPGMDEKMRKHAFDPFFTTKQPGLGTGLGLSVSYFIITENHNGTLEVNSHTGQWTEFSISLPRHGRK